MGEVITATTPKITTAFRSINGFALPSMHHSIHLSYSFLSLKLPPPPCAVLLVYYGLLQWLSSKFKNVRPYYDNVWPLMVQRQTVGINTSWKSQVWRICTQTHVHDVDSIGRWSGQQLQCASLAPNSGLSNGGDSTDCHCCRFVVSGRCLVYEGWLVVVCLRKPAGQAGALVFANVVRD